MITILHHSSTKKIAAFVAVMTAVAIPFRVSGVAVEQAVLVLALLASFVGVWKSADVRRRFVDAVSSTQGILIAVVFVAWVVVLPFSRDTMGSLEIGGRTGLFIMAVVLVGSVLKETPEHHALLWKALIISAVGAGMAAVLSLLGGDIVLSILTADFDGDVYAKVTLKAYATVVVCLTPVVILAGRELGGTWRYAGYFYIPVALAIVFLTENRSAMAGVMSTIVVFLTMLALGKRRYWKTVFVSILTVSSVIILWIRHNRYTYESSYGDITYLPGWLIDPHRQNIWKFVYEKFLDHPWVGNGIDQLNKLPGAHQIVESLGPSAYVVPSHPHNWGLEILGETGLIGFTPVVIALGYLAWKTGKTYLDENSEFALAKLSLFTGFWTCSLFSYSIWAVWWQLVFYMLFAILSATQSKSPSVS